MHTDVSLNLLTAERGKNEQRNLQDRWREQIFTALDLAEKNSQALMCQTGMFSILGLL